MTFDHFDQFEAYTNNSLPSDQRKQIEQQLAADALLRAELADYQQFRHSIEAIALKQQLEKIHAQLDQQRAFPPSASPGRVRRSNYGWAAALIVLVAGFGLYWALHSSPAAQTFVDYYRPEPVARGANDCVSALIPGIRAYRTGNYQLALSTIEKLPTDQPCVRYYRGLVQLALGNASVAITELEQAVSTPPAEPDLTYQKAEWYLALAYLKADKLTRAQYLLQKIVNQPVHPFRNQAQKILRDLNNA